MNKDNLAWYVVDRERLPRVALGLSPPTGNSARNPHSILMDDNRVAVGFPTDLARMDDYCPPSAFVLDTPAAAEVLSWLHVYNPETFPLSQFGRVVTSSDWELFDGIEHHGSSRTDQWASLILGEMLAQSDTDTDLSSVPLSRASGCFSTAMARAYHIYGDLEAAKVCEQRLREIQGDRQFSHRTISTTDLFPAWATLTSGINAFDLREAIDVSLESARKFEARKALRDIDLHDYPELFSDSAEGRVLAFRKLSNVVANLAPETRVAASTAATIAAAAFLVGRSTSHVFLLRTQGINVALSLIWFSLIAALAGPRHWDAKWLRASKSIERQLRNKFSWHEPSHSDICWVEYAWLKKAVSSNKGLSDVSRVFPRALAIEVIPGVTCQFRLASNDQPSNAVEQQRARAAAIRETELKSALEQLVSIAHRLRSIAGTSGVPTTSAAPPTAETVDRAGRADSPEQPSLTLSEPRAPTRTSKRKSPRKSV